MVACCEIGIIHLVLMISQKDYVLYKRRINTVCARHAVISFGNLVIAGLRKIRLDPR